MAVLKIGISRVSKEIKYGVDIFLCHGGELFCGGFKLFIKEKQFF